MKIDRSHESPYWEKPRIEKKVVEQVPGDKLEISELAKAMSKIRDIPDRTIEIPAQLEPVSLRLAIEKMLRENL